MKIKLPTFSSPLSEHGSIFINFIYTGMVFPMGFRVQPLSVLYGVSYLSLMQQKGLENTPILVTCIYQANALNIHFGLCEVQEANQGSEEAGSWCSQRQKESRERSEL